MPIDENTKEEVKKQIEVLAKFLNSGEERSIGNNEKEIEAVKTLSEKLASTDNNSINELHTFIFKCLVESLNEDNINQLMNALIKQLKDKLTERNSDSFVRRTEDSGGNVTYSYAGGQPETEGNSPISRTEDSRGNVTYSYAGGQPETEGNSPMSRTEDSGGNVTYSHAGGQPASLIFRPATDTTGVPAQRDIPSSPEYKGRQKHSN